MSDARAKSADPPGAADLSGRQIGQFHVLRRLGRGAMAEVYLAEQRPLKRWVALKILRAELANDQTYLKRFHREAQAAASLVHANIVQIHEVGHLDGLHFIVQEYVQGQNLRDWLSREGLPALPQALSIMRQVASALAKAAEAGVVHRDIKPENILLTASGEVKVADFGLARVLRQTEAEVTQVGMTMGTPLYMSPEQVEGKPLDPRSDLYSFGVTCYHMLSGNPPFVGDTALAVAVQHVRNPPRPLETLRPDLPPALLDAVHRLLAKDPDQRWQSARDLLRELCRIHQEYCPQAAPDEADLWASAGLEPLCDSRLRATQRLEAAMHAANALSAPRYRRSLAAHIVRAGIVPAGMAAVGLLSALAAWLLVRPAPLLSPPNVASERIPRQPTVVRQWYYASQIGTEQAWQSVVDFFPDKDYYVARARQQLARIYLRQRDYDRALTVCEELAAVSGTNVEFRAFGLAGKCGILTLQGKYRESAGVLNALWPIHQDLRDAQMRKMLDYVVKENRLELGPQTRQQWDDWLSEQFHAEG
ncbi:MAG: serine/threonine-protein kinase [Thermoguttaceae bacterium]